MTLLLVGLILLLAGPWFDSQETVAWIILGFAALEIIWEIIVIAGVLGTFHKARNRF